MQLTFRDVIEAFHVSENEVHDWIEKKNMPYTMANEQRYFNYIALLDWALGNKIPLTPELLSLGEREQKRTDIVYKALRAGGIFYDVLGKNRMEVIKAIVDILPLGPKLNKETLGAMLISREKLTSTGVGGGIAIPHVRNPIVLPMDRSSISLCFLKNTVDFKAMDHKPVNIVFTLLAPTVKEHMAILSRLAFCLQNARLLEFLHDRAPAEQILAEFKVLDSIRPL
jgi:PTS system nitrogen regulatory IIA component